MIVKAKELFGKRIIKLYCPPLTAPRTNWEMVIEKVWCQTLAVYFAEEDRYYIL